MSGGVIGTDGKTMGRTEYTSNPPVVYSLPVREGLNQGLRSAALFRSQGEQSLFREIRGEKNSYEQEKAGCWPGLERGRICE